MVGRTGAKEEALSFFFCFFFIFFWGVRHRRRPLYLYNCKIWFMGFREVLCVSFPGRPGDMGGVCGGRGGLAFVMINIQADSHLEPRQALPGFGFIYIYKFKVFCILRARSVHFFSLFLHCKKPLLMHCPRFSTPPIFACARCTRTSSRDLGRRGACRGTPEV